MGAGNLTLNDLSGAFGGKAGEVLFSDWPVRENKALGALKLSDVGSRGHWALVPDCVPAETESSSIEDSVAALENHYAQYQQPDVISFTAALLLNAARNGKRWYPDTYAWCKDPRVGTQFENDGGFVVGFFLARGLRVNAAGPSNARPPIGCAAVWNFGI